MRKTLLAAVLVASPAMAEVPDTPQCAELRALIGEFSQRFEDGILPADISPQIEEYHDILDTSDPYNPDPEVVEGARQLGRELGLKLQMMRLNPEQMMFVTQNIHRVVGKCVYGASMKQAKEGDLL